MNLLDVLNDLPDPRLDRQKKHRLIDIVALTICGVLAGENTFVDIEFYAREKEAFFKTFLELPNGTPSHDTFTRVWGLICPQKFEACFSKWLNSVKEMASIKNGVVAIDGKTMRGSANKSKGEKGLHIISAFATELGISMGQTSVDDKSNEITAIPNLLDMLYLEGCIVTLDAMGCQKEIQKKIIEKKADYCLALKKNQPQLHEDISLFMSDEKNFNAAFEQDQTIEKDHGRVEIRRCTVSHQVDWLHERHPAWSSIRTLIRVDSERIINGVSETQQRFYISSAVCNAKLAQAVVRSHWGVENQLHYLLDVVFREDEHQLRNRTAAANLNVIRKMSLDLLKSVKSTIKFPSLKAKRKLASWNNDFLLNLLGVVNPI
jgi:predicted transposase YbfD/YdcC